MQYCNSVLVLLSEIFDNLQAVYQRICHELNRGLGRTFSERDWVNQQRNLGEAARKETTRRRKTFRVSEEDAEGISSMARLQMTRGQLGQSQNAENAAGSNPSRSTAHVTARKSLILISTGREPWFVPVSRPVPLLRY